MAKDNRGGKRANASTSKKQYGDDEIIDALQRFTSNQYSNIRKAQDGETIIVRKMDHTTKTIRSVDVTDKYKDYGGAIEQYIDNGNGYKNTLYRGISVDDTTLNSFRVGQTIHQHGTSSWTTVEKTATNFSDRGKIKLCLLKKMVQKEHEMLINIQWLIKWMEMNIYNQQKINRKYNR